MSTKEQIQSIIEMNSGTTIPDSAVMTRWVLITPDMAKSFLELNEGNRLMREKHIDRIVSDMKADRFVTTHQGLAFDTDGRLIDGQHRCRAIIESACPQWMLVTTGLPPLAQRVIDGGAKRAVHDMMNGKFKATRSAAIRHYLAIQYCGGEFTAGTLNFAAQQITAAAIQEAWDDFPGIDRFAPMAHEAHRNTPICGPSPLLVSAMIYPDTADEFLAGLKSMAGLDPGDGRLALLRARPSNGRATSTPIACALVIKAAKAFATGKTLSVLRFSPTEKVKV